MCMRDARVALLCLICYVLILQLASADSGRCNLSLGGLPLPTCLGLMTVNLGLTQVEGEEEKKKDGERKEK